jgi:hypothetical protein
VASNPLGSAKAADLILVSKSLEHWRLERLEADLVGLKEPWYIWQE